MGDGGWKWSIENSKWKIEKAEGGNLKYEGRIRIPAGLQKTLTRLGGRGTRSGCRRENAELSEAEVVLWFLNSLGLLVWRSIGRCSKLGGRFVGCGGLLPMCRNQCVRFVGRGCCGWLARFGWLGAM